MSNESRARDLAAAFRAEHDLGDAPIKDLFELAFAELGVDVLSMEAAEEEHGLSMVDAASGRVVIAVATTANPMRQRSSIAHELGHVVAGDLDHIESMTPGERSPEEIRADAFGRHLLLPLEAVRRRHAAHHAQGGPVTLRELSDLVQEFEVSPHLAAIQLREVGFIKPERCREWSQLSAGRLATTFGWRSQHDSLRADSLLPRSPQGLMARAVEGYRRGVVSIDEVASWYRHDAEDLAADLSEDLAERATADPDAATAPAAADVPGIDGGDASGAGDLFPFLSSAHPRPTR